MPVYACCRSDCGHLAIQGPNGFVLKDALGRDWLCVETPLQDLSVDVSKALDAMSDVRQRADRLGVYAEGAPLTLVDCPGRSGLAQELVRASCPSPAESMNRLREAGWRNLREEVRALNKVRVAASRGRETIKATGENDTEAWYLAAQQALVQSHSAIGRRPVTLTLSADPLPLRRDVRGVVRVGRSRVPWDMVIRAFHEGASPESIVRAYPSLQLADTYAVIAFYLRHRKAADAYLRRREAKVLELELKMRVRQAQPAQEGLRLEQGGNISPTPYPLTMLSGPDSEAGYPRLGK
jgi:uncharacterized protein (DUF433 family)